jgi:hypothetical protein
MLTILKTNLLIKDRIKQWAKTQLYSGLLVDNRLYGFTLITAKKIYPLFNFRN